MIHIFVNFDSSIPVGISCDAADVGLGVVLFRRYPDGSEKPIANVSKILTDVTDHCPLLSLLNPSKAPTTLAANHLTRWALMLSQYDYTIECRKTSHYGNVDVLSRIPNGPVVQFDEGEMGDTVYPFVAWSLSN